MKLRINNVLEICIYVLILINLGLFKIIDINVLNNDNRIQKFTVIFSIILFLICLFSASNQKEIQRNYKVYLNKYILIIILILICNCIFTSLNYTTTIFDLITVIYRFAIILLAYPIIYLFWHVKDINRILKFISVATFVSLIIRYFTWFMYNKRGISLFPNILNEYSSLWIRNGLLRLSDTSLTGITFVILIYFLLNNEMKKPTRIVMLFMATFCVFYANIVYASRAQFISMLLTSFVMIILNRSTKKGTIIKMLIFCIFVVLLSNSSYLDNLLQSFSTTSQYSLSTSARINAFHYYFDLWKNSPLCGIGVLNTNREDFYYIVHASVKGGFTYYEDLGILGLLFNFGLLGFLIFLIPFRRFLKIILSYWNSNIKEKILLIGLFCYFIFSCLLSQSVFDSQRILSLPFYIAIFEYVKYKNKKLPLNKKLLVNGERV